MASMKNWSWTKFIGATKGNKDIESCRNLDDALGGSGEGHSFNKSKWAGVETKGNRDLPPNRSTGVKGGGGKRSNDIVAEDNAVDL
jgi:hypothetical protein